MLKELRHAARSLVRARGLSITALAEVRTAHSAMMSDHKEAYPAKDRFEISGVWPLWWRRSCLRHARRALM